MHSGGRDCSVDVLAIVGVCILTEAPFLSSVRRTKKESEDSLHPRLGEESSKEEGDRAMQLGVFETETGSLGPAKMAVNMWLGRVQRLEVQVELLSTDCSATMGQGIREEIERPQNAVSQERLQGKRRDPDLQTSFLPKVAAVQKQSLKWNLPAASQSVLFPSPTSCPLPKVRDSSGHWRTTATWWPHSSDSLGAQDASVDRFGCSVFFVFGVYPRLGNPWFE